MDSADVVKARELYNQAIAAGFRFRQLRVDSALLGRRETELWVDHLRLDGVETGCSAKRQIKDTRLPLPPVAEISGSAIEVLVAVLHWTHSV